MRRTRESGFDYHLVKPVDALLELLSRVQPRAQKRNATPRPHWPPRARLSRVKSELLRAPIQQFRDVELVFGRACYFVYPAELLQGLARSTQPP